MAERHCASTPGHTKELHHTITTLIQPLRSLPGLRCRHQLLSTHVQNFKMFKSLASGFTDKRIEAQFLFHIFSTQQDCLKHHIRPSAMGFSYVPNDLANPKKRETPCPRWYFCFPDHRVSVLRTVRLWVPKARPNKPPQAFSGARGKTNLKRSGFLDGFGSVSLQILKMGFLRG